MTRLSAILAMGAGVIMASCSTITSGTTDVVRISSIPDHATVEIDGKTYATPVTLTLSRSRSYEVLIQKEGYLPAHRVISRVGNTATEGNFIAGGMVGLLTDQSTGAAFRLFPTDLSVELVPAGSPDEKIYEGHP